jgi:hypothetical protein
MREGGQGRAGQKTLLGRGKGGGGPGSGGYSSCVACCLGTAAE